MVSHGIFAQLTVHCPFSDGHTSYYSNQQIVSMIKDVLKQLWAKEAFLNEAIRKDVHMRTQQFIQNTVRDMIRHATKKKKSRAKT
jgi:hypothetical protein